MGVGETFTTLDTPESLAGLVSEKGNEDAQRHQLEDLYCSTQPELRTCLDGIINIYDHCPVLAAAGQRFRRLPRIGNLKFGGAGGVMLGTREHVQWRQPATMQWGRRILLAESVRCCQQVVLTAHVVCARCRVTFTDRMSGGAVAELGGVGDECGRNHTFRVRAGRMGCTVGTDVKAHAGTPPSRLPTLLFLLASSCSPHGRSTFLSP